MEVVLFLQPWRQYALMRPPPKYSLVGALGASKFNILDHQPTRDSLLFVFGPNDA